MPYKKEKKQVGTVLNMNTPASEYSDEINLRHMSAYSLEVQIAEVSSAVGTFSLEFSLGDPDEVWHPDPNTALGFTGNTNHMFTIVGGAFYKKARVKYTNTSGEFNVKTYVMEAEQFL